MPEHTEPSGWALARMETLSWVNLVAGAAVVASAFLFDLPGWSFWTAVVAGGTIVVLEVFDEWAEQHGLAAETVGPESVVLVAALWLAGTVLVTGGPATFVALAFVAGLLVAVTSAVNLLASLRMDPTNRIAEQHD